MLIRGTHTHNTVDLEIPSSEDKVAKAVDKDQALHAAL
jgi:hypothetical protein